MTALLLGLTLVGMGTLPVGPPPRDQPEPKLKVEQVIALTGKASHYDYIPGHAAAGPKLRSMLGKHWRGTKVQVCTDKCVTVTLSDWCQCYKGEKRERIIDLHVGVFAALGPTWKGVMKVTVRE